MTWDRELETASFDGVEFQVEKTQDSLPRRWAVHTYPYKDGADVDDMGRDARPTKLTAVFVGEDATTDLGKLMMVVDKGETATFQHPLFGSWKAKMRITGIDSSHAFRDGYRAELDVLEDGTATELPTIFSIETLSDGVTSAATAVSTALSAIDKVGAAWDDAVSAVNDAIDAATSFVEKAKSYASKVEDAVNKVRSTIKKAQRAINKALAAPEQAFAIVTTLLKMGAACVKLGRSVASSAPKMMASAVTATQSTAQLAVSLYGDGSRAKEIEAANNIRNPSLVRPGTALTAPQK